MAHDHREDGLLVHEHLLAVERDLHVEHGNGLDALDAGPEQERREQERPRHHHVLPPGLARGLPPNSFVT